MQIHIDRTDEHSAGKKARNDVAQKKQHNRAHNIRNVAQQARGEQVVGGGAKCFQADQKTYQHNAPENYTRDQNGGV